MFKSSISKFKWKFQREKKWCRLTTDVLWFLLMFPNLLYLCWQPKDFFFNVATSHGRSFIVFRLFQCYMYLYFPIVDVNDYSLYSDVMKFGVGWLALLSTFRITVDGVDNLIDLFSNRTFFLLFVFRQE